MNIITYVTPVGIRPTRRWVMSLYKTTQSYQNFAASGAGVLQLLRRRHAPLIYPLGGQVRAYTHLPRNVHFYRSNLNFL
jgi:hypothetical protein